VAVFKFTFVISDKILRARRLTVRLFLCGYSSLLIIILLSFFPHVVGETFLMMKNRTRFSKDLIGENLASSRHGKMHLEEPILQYNCIERYKYIHWIKHINGLLRYINGKAPIYDVRVSFDDLKQILASSLPMD
jgi:hypothetical protein